ncbi:MAG: metal dependent phosphohydrolase [candidate division WS6 bacterium 34_10]|uniref:Metal dependent phosphohydrolase n=1 Tax=candidate division WS6 bacterium 34_10 TaxID=1641389 RepID=A0A101HHQ6_9BACT|nr:MAG: metal dependent phosphohydrolase [candidate division WS6 bacterium 34_10]
MIERSKAQELIDKYVTTDWLKLHMRESEVIMRALAKHLGKDPDLWGITGLLHDIDYDFVDKDPKTHGVEFEKILEKEKVELPEEVVHAIKAHNEESELIDAKRESDLDYALAASENLSGFLVACALVMPDKKIKSVKVESVIQKLKKDKSFARAVRRDLIFDIEKVGITLEEFIEIALDAVCKIDKEIGL